MSHRNGPAHNGPSQRQLRVGEQVRHILSDTLRRGHFTDATLFESARDITVTEVRISPDMKNATAYIMALGGRNMADVMPALNNAAAYFQKEIGRNMNMKFTPRIRFVSDDSFDEAARIETILRGIPAQGAGCESDPEE